MINPKAISGTKKPNWSEQKARLRNMYPVVTDEDFDYEIGKKDVMLNKLAAKINKTRDELEEILIAF